MRGGVGGVLTHAGDEQNKRGGGIEKGWRNARTGVLKIKR